MKLSEILKIMRNKRLKNILGTKLYFSLRNSYLYPRSIVLIGYGFIYFTITGENTQAAYQAMIWLFCSTRGRFNDWVSILISWGRPPINLPSQVGVLGDMSDKKQLSQVVGQLQDKGFVIFPSTLPSDLIDRLRKFADTTPALVRRMDGQSGELYKAEEIYNGGTPMAVRYDYKPADLLNNEDVQDLLADGSFLSIAQEYLGCEPIADVLSMWWHTNFCATPDAEAAQYFHFDMDRFKWLKIFIYLTDVESDNGPHSFVEGSHKSGAIPAQILNRGYVRISDEEIAGVYSSELVHSFTAPRGTIIIEDTRGLHKGIHVSGNSRLILQMQFSNFLFGTNYPGATLSKVKSEQFKKIYTCYPEIYRQYLK